MDSYWCRGAVLFLSCVLFFLLTLSSSSQVMAKDFIITVEVSAQKLYLFEDIPFKNPKLVKTYPVSTSKYGTGPTDKKTPLGTHIIAEKIGRGARIGTVFVARRRAGWIARIHNDTTDTENDFITTRILWLKGIQPGINEGEGVSSYYRYIYIHGTSEEGLIGSPASNGCIRMKNKDIIELFRLVPEGTLVNIHR